MQEPDRAGAGVVLASRPGIHTVLAMTSDVQGEYRTREFEVLAYLAARPDKALSPETIYTDVWRQEFGDITAVAVYIQRLRRKIEEDPSHPRFLQTVTGKGYRFSPGGES